MAGKRGRRKPRPAVEGDSRFRRRLGRSGADPHALLLYPQQGDENGVFRGGLYRSGDWGETWESAMGQGLNPETKKADQWACGFISQYNQLLATDAKPLTLYAFNTSTGFHPPHSDTVYRSDDGSETWRATYFQDPRFQSYNVALDWETASFGQCFKGGETPFGVAICNADPTVGVLPDLWGAAFWLIDAGLHVKELSWADVADPAVFSPRNFPLLGQTGGEHYSSTGKFAGDVVPAIQHYLARGGFLISLPDGPFPFYYDTVPVANQVGLPVKQGWELPPDGAQLTFQFDTNAFLDFPAKGRFPSNGDLRWRPAGRDATNPGDTYVPLAWLTDASGRSYGEAMAYVEHRTPPLQGGRSLYVWMRMSDMVGQDWLLEDVLKFAAAKIGAPAKH